MLVETLFVDSFDLTRVATCIDLWEGVYGTSAWQAAPISIIGRPGAVVGGMKLEPFEWPLGLSVWDIDAQGMRPLSIQERVAQFHENVDAIKAALMPGPTIRTVKRRLSYPPAGSGDFDVIDQEARCMCRPLQPSMNKRRDDIQFTTSFLNLDGCWYGPAVEGDESGITMPGTTLTYRIQLVFAGAGTLTNDTLSRSVTVDAGGTMDVLGHTFTGGVGNVSFDADDSQWFALAPGVNSLSSTVGVSITARPAYL